MKFLPALLLIPTLLFSQEKPVAPTSAPDSEITPLVEPEKKPEPKKTTLEDDGTRVSVIGYHVFSDTQSATQMLIPTKKFREQMIRVKESGIPVITLDQFLKWRKGEGTLPPQCILITMDDGWKSVYTDAFPIMKELKLPFTIYLYQQYVDGGGRALTTPLIKELQSSGLVTIGCHSATHPFPGTVKKFARQGPDAYEKFLRKEIGLSKKFLEEKFGQKVTTYAYPGGYHTEEMHLLADEYGYDNLFTVIPGKVSRDSPLHALNRYIILGNNDNAFEAAMTFRGGTLAAATPGMAALPTTPYPVSPPPGALIESRLPTISADLTDVPDLDPESLVMRVGGFGEVPATFDPKNQTLAWKVNRPLRQPACQVTVHWKQKDTKTSEKPMIWSFRLDYTSAYLPR